MPTLKPKPAKELAYPNAWTEQYSAKMKDRITNDKNGQLVTAPTKKEGFLVPKTVFKLIKH